MSDEDQCRVKRRGARRPMGRTGEEEVSAAVWSIGR
uniref:Uncharacterized protein n=1 Tax=Arundo donax TaxID=35708 RepID=A0A0A9FCM4_ARUDO